jgi:hypothetical protein
MHNAKIDSFQNYLLSYANLIKIPNGEMINQYKLQTIYMYLKEKLINLSVRYEKSVNFPRPYGRGFTLFQTEFALYLFYLGSRYTI